MRDAVTEREGQRTMSIAIVVMLAAAVLVGLEPSGAAAITLEIVPAVQEVALGGPAEVAIVISDLGDQAAPSLGTFDIDLTFAPGILSFVSATFGDPSLGDQLDLFGLGSVTALTAGAGIVNLFELSLDLASDLDTLQAGAFTLVTLSLLGVGVGTTPIGLTINEMGDAAGALLDVETIGGTARIVGDGRVAEPATSTLLALGIAGLARYLSTRSASARRSRDPSPRPALPCMHASVSGASFIRRSRSARVSRACA